MAEIAHSDFAVSTFAWGWTVGFGFLTVWEAVKQTTRARSPVRSLYIWLVWGEILVCFLIGIMVYLLFTGTFQVSLAFLIILLALWTLKLHFVVQIIVNRINIIEPDRGFTAKLRWGSAAIILALNISVFVIWIPAQLKVNTTFERINNVWDRMTKVIYLAVDCGLNWIFIRTVKRRLVNQGITKYDRLVKFNVRIILVSLAMDLLILGSMSIKNPLVYTQIHPLAFIVKLRIELSMAKLIRKIAIQKYQNQNPFELSAATSRRGNDGIQKSTTKSTAKAVPVEPDAAVPHDRVMVHKTVMLDNSSRSSIREMDGVAQQNDDEPLRDDSWQRVVYAS